MRALVQRVSEGSVMIDGQLHAKIGKGFVILLGVRKGDTAEGARFLADKCSSLRVFDDGAGKMNLSLRDVGGESLVISQFTLYGDVRRGNRPGFADAAPPEEAEPLYEEFVRRMKETLGDSSVSTGVFRAMMNVHIANDGPVTLLLESA
ncbi:MAG: D-aminoacyl-tRNA deacylase [Ignavibacteria bacterium]|nr:D-aminoacyl-tRNA deacylase [Ignavibacteria bacterium]